MTGNAVPRRYLAILAATLILLVLFLLAAHLTLDPYGLLPSPVQGLNVAKPAINRHERISTAIALRRQCARTLVLGSSRALHGIDPSALADAVGEAPGYNAGIGSPSLHVVFDYLRMAHERCPLKKVFIGLDLQMFNGYKADRDLDYEWFSGAREQAALQGAFQRLATLSGIVFSPDAIRDSYQTLAANRRGEAPQRTPLGQMNDVYYVAKNRALGGYAASFDYELLGYLSYLAPPRYAFDLETGLRVFGEMAAYLRERNVDAAFVVLPVHAYEQAGVRMLGLQEIRDRWIRQLASLSAGRQKIIHCSPFGRHETEEVPQAGDAKEMAYWWESSHFKRAVGAEIVAEVSAIMGGRQNAGGLCARLDTGSVEEILRKVSLARSAWSESHRADLRRIHEGVRRSIASQHDGANIAILSP